MRRGSARPDRHSWPTSVAEHRQAMLDDPIVGVGAVIVDKHGAGALQPIPLRTPKAVTSAENEIHHLTRMPVHGRCEICQATRGLNAQHRLCLERDRAISLLVADYGFVRFSNRALTRTTQVMSLCPLPLIVFELSTGRGLNPLLSEGLLAL